MINTLNIKQTPLTPKIQYRSHKNCLEISGRSITLDAEKFWKPIIGWYIQKSLVNNNISIAFNLEYMNSATQKFILKFFKSIETAQKEGLVTPGKIKWNYDEHDSDMYDLGKFYRTYSGLEFEFVELKTSSIFAA